jgi:PAS domain S-box-containing protein
VSNAIRVLVASLGDFPLEPDAGKAWLWSGNGETLLWVSDASREALKITNLSEIGPLTAKETFRSYVADLYNNHPHLQPIRVQQLNLTNGHNTGSFSCLCRHVPLIGGGYGLLAVAVGAPARSMEAIREQSLGLELPPEPKKYHNAYDENTTISEFKPEQLILSPNPSSVDTTENDIKYQSPNWTSEDATLRRPLRFVWQTDSDGRFVHLSRELSDAVGQSNAMLIGLTWSRVVEQVNLQESEDIASGFAFRDTWTAKPALWPVEHSDLGVPVEMAGMLVSENGQFAGFRGYGIARVERAVVRPNSAAIALAADTIPETEKLEDRFGPAIQRALAEEEPSTKSDGVPSSLGPYVAPTPHYKSVLYSATVRNPLEISKAPSHLDAEVKPTVVKQDPESRLSLSAAERERFREIAKALGDVTLPRPSFEKAEDAAHEMPETPQVVLPGSLEALKQDLFERSGMTMDMLSPEKAESSQEQKPSPIVPYDTLQARRGQKNPTLDPLKSAGPSIIEHLSVGLLVMQEGQIVFANRHLLDLADYNDFASFNADGSAEKLFGRRRSDNSNDTENGLRSFTITTRNGRLVQVDATIQAIVWNEKPATLTTIKQIQEQVLAPLNRALELDFLAAKVELTELQSVLDTATDGIISLDGEGRILSLNRSAEALFGFDQSEIVGESITVLFEPESHVAALDYLEGLKSNGVQSILNDGRDVKGRERNGGTIPLFMTIGRVGEGQSASRFCAVLRDITHWKKVETDLTEAKRAAEDSSAHKTDFLAKISHEIRTPLNAIIGFSQVMMSESFGPLSNERYKQYIKDINASGEHVVSLVNDLLDLSKVASGKLELTFGSVDLNTVVAACVAMIQPQANAGKVIVRSQLVAHLPPVVADERSVRQIVINLLSNAAKFTEAGGQVIASTSFTDKGEVIIRVRDTGIGMAEDDVKRAMEPFRQIPGPRSGGGTGLGLPLTKALVEANRAGFSIQSEPKEGTLVEVTFPSTRVLAE